MIAVIIRMICLLTSTTAADSAMKAFKQANELNGDGNEQLWRELGAVAARATKPKSVQPNVQPAKPSDLTSAGLQKPSAV
jgi:hypothetical protein